MLGQARAGAEEEDADGGRAAVEDARDLERRQVLGVAQPEGVALLLGEDARTELRRGLWDLAARVLSEEQRDALWLRYAEDLPPLEIARVLDRRPSTVRVLLFRARARLAEHLPAPDAATTPETVPIKIAGERR